MATVDLVGIRPLMQATLAALFKFEMFDGVGDGLLHFYRPPSETFKPRRCTIGIIADLSDRVQIFADGRLRVNLAHHCVVGIFLFEVLLEPQPFLRIWFCIRNAQRL
jgi:hypothetical protein